MKRLISFLIILICLLFVNNKGIHAQDIKFTYNGAQGAVGDTVIVRINLNGVPLNSTFNNLVARVKFSNDELELVPSDTTTIPISSIDWLGSIIPGNVVSGISSIGSDSSQINYGSYLSTSPTIQNGLIGTLRFIIKKEGEIILNPILSVIEINNIEFEAETIVEPIIGINTAAPTKPVFNVFPSDSIILSFRPDSLVTWSWSESTDSDGEEVSYFFTLNEELSDEPLFSYEGTLTSVSYSFTQLSDSLFARGYEEGDVGLFTARLSSTDGNIVVNADDYSIPFRLETINQGWVTPSQGSVIRVDGLPIDSIRFEWLAAAFETGETTYNAGIYLTEAANTPILSKTGTETFWDISLIDLDSLLNFFNIEPGNRFDVFAKLNAINNEESVEYEVVQFTLERGFVNTAPELGTWLSPNDNFPLSLTGSASNTLDFEWTESTDADNDSLFYLIQFSLSSAFETIDLSYTTTDNLFGVPFGDIASIIPSNQANLTTRVGTSDGVDTLYFDSRVVSASIDGLNTAPSQVSIVSPLDGDSLLIEGTSEDFLRVQWTTSSDVDNDPITYNWVLASSQDNNIELFALDGLESTSLSVPFTLIDSVLEANFIPVGETIELFHKVEAADAFGFSTSDLKSVILTRGVVNNPPTTPILQNPNNLATILLEGSDQDVLQIEWSPSTDLDNDAIDYTWVLSTSSEFKADSLLDLKKTQENSISYTKRVLTNLLEIFTGISFNQQITLYHRVDATDGISVISSDTLSFEVFRGTFTSIQDDLPTELALNQNYPNPFNPVTTIQFSLPESSFASLSVYNLSGKEMVNLTNSVLKAGNHTFHLDASNFPSGVYIYKLVTPESVLTKKMTLLK